jgi:hypothetical protein
MNGSFSILSGFISKVYKGFIKSARLYQQSEAVSNFLACENKKIAHLEDKRFGVEKNIGLLILAPRVNKKTIKFLGH